MGGCHGHDSMVVGFITSMQSVPIATNDMSSNTVQAMNFNLLFSTLSLNYDM